MLRRPDEVRIVQEVETEMQASVTRMLARERQAGGTGRATALAIQRNRGDWRMAERQLESLIAHGMHVVGE
jgi:hypothetical protein